MPLVGLVVHQVILVTIHCTGLHLHLRNTVILVYTPIFTKFIKFLRTMFCGFFFNLKLTSYLIICTKFSMFTWTFWLQDFWRTICFRKNTFRKVAILKLVHPTVHLLRESEKLLGLAGQRANQTAPIWTNSADQNKQVTQMTILPNSTIWQSLTSTQTKHKFHTTAPNSFSKLLLSCSNIEDWPCLKNKSNFSETWH